MSQLKFQRYYWLIYAFGMLLVFNAGYVNVIVLTGYLHHAVTHVTGTVSNFAIQVALGDINGILDFGCLLLSFMLGAAWCGYLIKKPKFSYDFNYTHVLLNQGFFVYLAWYIHTYCIGYGSATAYLLAFTAGMQNAMLTKFSGAEIRTTHVTGILTDFGIEIGHLFRRDMHVCVWKMKLFFSTLLFFFLGGIVGFYAYIAYHSHALLLTLAIYFGLAITYPSVTIWRRLGARV